MNKGGHAIVFDSILGFIIIIVFLSTLKAPQMNPYTEVVVSQKAHDLLTLWQVKKNLSPDEMKKDFLLTFAEKNGEIKLGEKKIMTGNGAGKKAFSYETFFLNEKLEATRLTLTIFD